MTAPAEFGESLPVDEDEWSWSVEAEPRDEMEVERRLRLLERLSARFAQVRGQAAAWRAEIDSWEAREVAKLAGRATPMALGLEAWALAQRRVTGSKSFSFPSGVLETRKGRDKVVVTDEAALLAWCEKECPDAVKVVRSVLTSKLPAHEVSVEGRMVVEGGEVVPGVQVQSGANYVSADVKLASARELPRGRP